MYSRHSTAIVFARIALILTLGALLVRGACADDIAVAVASNFTAPLQRIATQFQTDTGHRIVASYGATGKFYAQIQHGAPFAILLAADRDTPARLEAEGAAVTGTRFTYALGRLVLWSPKPGLVDAAGEILQRDTFGTLALANPKLAPYGRAAQEVLEHRGLWQRLQTRLVRGENIAQTYQFVVSGNAQLGFIALAQIKTSQGIAAGSYWMVPQALYSPIEQQAVLLKTAAASVAAQQFLRYLQAATARDIIHAFGYDLPAASARRAS